MPVFAVSESFGKAVAKSSGAAYYPLTHQHGHIGAALLEHGLQGEFLALHVSGGTTDLLLVTAENGVIREIRPLGGTLDIAAGQLVDRVGQALGLHFPSGPEAFCSGGAGPAAGHCLLCPWARSELFRRGNCGKAHDRRGDAQRRCRGIHFKMRGQDSGKTHQNARMQTRVEKVLLFGGVMSSTYLRSLLAGRLETLYFAGIQYASDNACGLAMQARNLYLAEGK